MRRQRVGVKYSETRLGGGVSSAGIAYPGGLDLTTPTLSLQSGALRLAQNFECSQAGGYARIQGYERTDGRAKPSDASFTMVQFSAFSYTPVSGDTLTQATSAATGKVCWINNGVDGVYWVAVTMVVGTFDTSHVVSDGGNTVGTPISPTASITPKVRAQAIAAAADLYRALIGLVPGSGSLVDVFGLNVGGTDQLFAIRANAGNTALAIYKASTSGWTLVPFFYVLSFTAGGTATALDGNTLTQGAVSATVKRVVQATGAWTGTAAGKLVITQPSGGTGHFAAGAATLSSGATITISGAEAVIAPLPGGKGEHTLANFSGGGASKRIYGVDGVNDAYEFDGITYTPIATGFTAPTHITNHKNYLVVTKDSSFGGSGPGLPFRWDAASGAWEIATGDVVTGIISLPGAQTSATMGVFQRGGTSFLYGLDVSTFNYISFNTGLGALPYSVKNLFDVFVFDDLGVVTLQTTLNWGNFLPSALTKSLLPWIVQERTKLTASVTHKVKSQYRVFFSDGYGLYVTMINRQYLGAIPVLFPNSVVCADEVDLSNGDMTTYFGSTNGYVYELDKGTSFDGTGITAWMTPAWDALKSPRVLKRFRGASIEIQGNAYIEAQWGYSYSYGSSSRGQMTPVGITSSFSPAPNWDAFTWDAFYWDGQTLGPTDVDMAGSAENVQPSITCNAAYVDTFNVNSIIYHYTPRRGLRV